MHPFFFKSTTRIKRVDTLIRDILGWSQRDVSIVLSNDDIKQNMTSA
jgi:hypothetical protein